jgi:hypothetical protein
MRSTFGCEKQEVTVGQRKLHNKELFNFFFKYYWDCHIKKKKRVVHDGTRTEYFDTNVEM